MYIKYGNRKSITQSYSPCSSAPTTELAGIHPLIEGINNPTIGQNKENPHVGKALMQKCHCMTQPHVAPSISLWWHTGQQATQQQCLSVAVTGIQAGVWLIRRSVPQGKPSGESTLHPCFKTTTSENKTQQGRRGLYLRLSPMEWGAPYNEFPKAWDPKMARHETTNTIIFWGWIHPWPSYRLFSPLFFLARKYTSWDKSKYVNGERKANGSTGKKRALECAEPGAVRLYPQETSSRQHGGAVLTVHRRPCRGARHW